MVKLKDTTLLLTRELLASSAKAKQDVTTDRADPKSPDWVLVDELNLFIFSLALRRWSHVERRPKQPRCAFFVFVVWP